MTSIKTTLIALSSYALIGLSAAPSVAGPQDYRFEASRSLVKSSDAGFVEIRLIHLPTGKVVENATIVASKLEMPMNGMSTMNASATFVPMQNPTPLRFAVSVPMDGSWLLGVTAKIPGEAEPVHGVVSLYIESRMLPQLHRKLQQAGPLDEEELREDEGKK